MPPKRRNKVGTVEPPVEINPPEMMVEDFDIETAKNKIAQLEEQLRLLAMENTMLRQNVENKSPEPAGTSGIRRKSTVMDSASKQKNNNMKGCSCTGSCANKKCGCVRKTLSCNEFCKCYDGCINKINNEDEENKENQEKNQNKNKETQQKDENNSEILKKTRAVRDSKKKENKNKEAQQLDDNNLQVEGKTRSGKENKKKENNNKETQQLDDNNLEVEGKTRSGRDNKKKENNNKETQQLDDNNLEVEGKTRSGKENKKKDNKKESKTKNKESKEKNKESKENSKESKEDRGKDNKPLLGTKNEKKTDSSENKPANNTDDTANNEKAENNTVGTNRTPKQINDQKKVRSLFDTPEEPVLINYEESSNSNDARIPEFEKIVNPMQPRRQLPRSPIGASVHDITNNTNMSFHDNAGFISIMKSEEDEEEEVPPPPEIYQAEVDWDEHQANLVVCQMCNRKFYRHRIKIHKRSCKKL